MASLPARSAHSLARPMRNLSFFNGISVPSLAPASTINFNFIEVIALHPRSNRKLHNKTVYLRTQNSSGGSDNQATDRSPKNKFDGWATHCDEAFIESYT